MVRSKIMDWAMGMMTKGELPRATVTWKQAHFHAIMSQSLQLPHTDSKGDGEVGNEVTPPQALTLQCPGAWMMFGDLSISLRRLPSLCFGPLVYMVTQVFGNTACRSTGLLNQHKAPSCSPPLS